MSKKIVLPHVNKENGLNSLIRPSSTNVQERYIRFSLKLLREIQNFEWGDADNSWYSALLLRLSDLETHTWSEFEANSGRISEIYRYHKIKWELSKVLKYSDLTWIPEDYRNEKEYPIYQFSISTGKGRFHGFKDEKGVFNILLLDINHNLQPSGKHNHQIRGTHPSQTSMDILQACINSCEHSITCPCHSTNLLDHNIIYFKFDIDNYLRENNITETIAPQDFEDIFKIGIDATYKES